MRCCGHVLSYKPHERRGAVGKWPAGATVTSLAEAGHLSTVQVYARVVTLSPQSSELMTAIQGRGLR